MANNSFPSRFTFFGALDEPLLIVSENSEPELLQKLLRLSNDFPDEVPVQTDLEKAKVAAPKVSYREVEEDNETFFLQPNHYIRWKDQDPDEVDFEHYRKEYELDSEDERWLDEQDQEITTDTFEKVMDKLEKAAFLQSDNQTEVIETQEDLEIDESDCVVCQEGYSEDNNQIVFCDGCEIAVHQNCYGIRTIPEGSWLCIPCSTLSMGAPQFLQCSLCFQQGGAFKKLEQGWVHVQCALYLPELEFKDPNCFVGNPVLKSPISKERRNLRCVFCYKTGGAAVQCSYKTCSTSFHVTCGQMRRLSFSFEEDETDNSLKTEQFCSQHTPISFRSTRRELMKRDKELFEKKKLLRSKRIQTKTQNQKKSTLIHCGGLDFDTANGYFADDGIPESVLRSIYKFWEKKRVERRGLALLKRFTPSIVNSSREVEIQSGFNNKHSYSVPTNRVKSTVPELVAVIPFLRTIRQQCERVRLMIEMIKKRETSKRNFAINSRDSFEASFVPLQRTLRVLLRNLIQEDKQQLFYFPVSREVESNYESKIKCPMDFWTIESKLNELKYNKYQQFIDDVELIFSNTFAFYSKDSAQFTEAERLQELLHKWDSEQETLSDPNLKETNNLSITTPQDISPELFETQTILLPPLPVFPRSTPLKITPKKSPFSLTPRKSPYSLKNSPKLYSSPGTLIAGTFQFPIKRGRGRPRKYPRPEDLVPPTTQQTPSSSPKIKKPTPKKSPLPVDPNTPKRGRGRPRKYPRPEDLINTPTKQEITEEEDSSSSDSSSFLHRPIKLRKTKPELRSTLSGLSMSLTDIQDDNVDGMDVEKDTQEPIDVEGNTEDALQIDLSKDSQTIETKTPTPIKRGRGRPPKVRNGPGGSPLAKTPSPFKPKTKMIQKVLKNVEPPTKKRKIEPVSPSPASTLWEEFQMLEQTAKAAKRSESKIGERIRARVPISPSKKR